MAHKKVFMYSYTNWDYFFMIQLTSNKMYT